MFQRLIESRSSVYLILGVVAIILGVIYARTRDRRLLYGLGGVAGVLLLFFLFQLIRGETAAEQIERKVKEMAAACQSRDLDRIFQHVSDQFDMNGNDKAALRRVAQQAFDQREVTELRVANFQRVDFVSGSPPTATIQFMCKIIFSDGEYPCRCVATFVKDPDGQWRLKSFVLYPAVGSNPLTVPGLN